jgi:hypothetical protein
LATQVFRGVFGPLAKRRTRRDWPAEYASQNHADGQAKANDNENRR